MPRYVVTARKDRLYLEHVRLLAELEEPAYGGFDAALVADRTMLCGAPLFHGWDTRLPLPRPKGRRSDTWCTVCRDAYLAAVHPAAPVKPPRVKRYRGEYTHPDTAAGLEGLVAWTDGSGTFQHSPAAIGVVVSADGEVICEASQYVGRGTNNVAELWAIGRTLAIVYAIARTRDVPLQIRSDSSFAIGAVRHGSAWELDPASTVGALGLKVRAEVARWPQIDLTLVAGHSGVLGNERADWLAGRARKAFIAATQTESHDDGVF